MKTLSSSLQIGPEARPLPPCAKSWEDYRELSANLKVACALVNSTLKRRNEPALYLIDNGGHAGVEAMTVLTPPEDSENLDER